MAVRDVRARLALDGEQQYKQALSEINSGNKVLGSEMKKLQAQYKGNTESTEFLTRKGEILERELYGQQEKVKTLREALTRAAQEYGEADKRTQEWQVKLNNAEAALYDTQHAIDENNAALQGEDETMKGLGDTIGDLGDKLGIRLPDGAKNALDGMMSFSSGTVAVLGTTVAAVTGVTEAMKKLHEVTLEAASDADDLITKSAVTGLSTRTLQTLKYAENLIDVSTDTITGSLTKLTKNMADAAGGGEKMSQAFADLGISIKNSDGSLRSAESVFYDIVDALGSVKNSTERDAAAMELLGRSAQELNPLILQGSGVLKDLAKEAETTGYVLDESQIAKLGEVDDAYQRMQLQLEATKKTLAEEFAPASTKAMEDFTRVVREGGEMLVNSGIVQGLGDMLTYSTAMLEPIGALLGIVPEATNEMKPLYTVLHGIAGAFAWIADAGNAAVGLLTGFTAAGRTRLNTALGLNAKHGMYSNLQRWDGTADRYDEWRASGYSGFAAKNYGYDSDKGLYYDKETFNYIYNYNAGGTDYWRGGMTWVGEAGPELVRLPAGSQILSNQDSRSFGSNTFYITIDAKSVREFNDVVELCRNARVIHRMRG